MFYSWWCLRQTRMHYIYMIPVINKKYDDMIPMWSHNMSMCRKAKMSVFIECWWSITMSVKCICVEASHLLSTGYCLNQCRPLEIYEQTIVILDKIPTLSFRKMQLKILSAKFVITYITQRIYDSNCNPPIRPHNAIHPHLGPVSI